MKVDVVAFAYQIVELDRENQRLHRENERLQGIEKRYTDLLNSSLKAQGVSSRNMLAFAMALGEGGAERLRGTCETLGIATDAEVVEQETT